MTFLFTDIEDSTRLWEAQQDSMKLALASHDAIMRGAVEEHSGHLVKTTGDGMYAVFANASDAIGASLSAQRALSTLVVGEVRLKARMALHSGNAELREGDYFGPVLSRASRLMAAAHGGQVVISLAACELVGDGLPEGVTLRDLGERRLKDLIRPERVFQLVSANLASEFPPLRTLDARPNNLPAQTTAFVGREAEIGAIKAQLRDANVRLLTLSGPGGTGKTRLAIQAAADLIDAYEHGGFFVPLAALTDAALVAQAIAQVFDIREAAGSALKDLLKEHLRTKQLLLVLDNFEQVVDAAPLVAELLSAAPRLNVLVTSREVLRVAGEKEYPLQPLALPDTRCLPAIDQLAKNEAVALFVERAAAAKSGFALSDENAAAIAQICVRLDGLPLAIELAAARVRILPPRRMLAELSDRLKFLVSGARDLPARQKTLRGAIDWSHELLKASEQALFRRLSVFVGGATFEAIGAICHAEGDPDLLETVESLVGKSLLRQAEIGGEPRFSMWRPFSSTRISVRVPPANRNT